MSDADAHLAIILTFISVLGLPSLAATIRIATRLTRNEDKLTEIAKDMTEIVAEMREDRKATNERLTYLERNVWPRRRRGED
jgi:hypothetical protein